MFKFKKRVPAFSLIMQLRKLHVTYFILAIIIMLGWTMLVFRGEIISYMCESWPWILHIAFSKHVPAIFKSDGYVTELDACKIKYILSAKRKKNTRRFFTLSYLENYIKYLYFENKNRSYLDQIRINDLSTVFHIPFRLYCIVLLQWKIGFYCFQYWSFQF